MTGQLIFGVGVLAGVVGAFVVVGLVLVFAGKAPEDDTHAAELRELHLRNRVQFAAGVAYAYQEAQREVQAAIAPVLATLGKRHQKARNDATGQGPND